MFFNFRRFLSHHNKFHKKYLNAPRIPPPQLPPTWAKMGPRWSKLAPSCPQIGPKLAKVGPSWPKVGPKLAPRWLKLAQVCLKLAQDGRKSAQVGPKTTQKVKKNLRSGSKSPNFGSPWPPLRILDTKIQENLDLRAKISDAGDLTRRWDSELEYQWFAMFWALPPLQWRLPTSRLQPISGCRGKRLGNT